MKRVNHFWLVFFITYWCLNILPPSQFKDLVHEVTAFSEQLFIVAFSIKQSCCAFVSQSASHPFTPHPRATSRSNKRFTLSTGAHWVIRFPRGHFDSSCCGRGECYLLAFPYLHVIKLSAPKILKIAPAGRAVRLGGSSANKSQLDVQACLDNKVIPCKSVDSC